MEYLNKPKKEIEKDVNKTSNRIGNTIFDGEINKDYEVDLKGRVKKL